MQLVLNPWQFDVIVTTNLFGDILSDLIAGLVGGLGAAPGANIGEKCAIFEAVHGSAPDIAGKGIANPTALLLAAGLMLDHVGRTDLARCLRGAINAVLNKDNVRTRDFGGTASTQEFAEAVSRRAASQQLGTTAMTKGSDLLVAALENEGVEYIFGVPGEENLDVVESLRNSRIELVLTRHEQSAAFMAATHGRLTGRPGVCIATLGPGALNLVTGAAYAHLGAMPMIMITGQKGIMSSRQARFQIVDMVATMRPLTKSTRQIVSTATIPTFVRDAFRVAMEERPGPVHLELPEDIAGEEAPDLPLVPPHPIELPVAPPAALDRAAAMILAAKRPLVMLGAASSRPRLTAGLTEFVRRTQIPFFNTQMGKGTVAGGHNLYLGTAALSERDYVHEAIDRADLIIAIGHDTIEKPPFLMGPDGPQVIHISFTPANVEQVYFPHAEVVGDVGPSLALLADRLEGKLETASALAALREEILRRIGDRADRGAASRRRRSGSSTTSARSCRKTASSRSTTACTRSGSPATTAPGCPTRCCSTMRWRRWVLACRRR